MVNSLQAVLCRLEKTASSKMAILWSSHRVSVHSPRRHVATWMLMLALARWAAAGKRITYLLATRGEAGIDAVSPKEARKIRTQEQIASCGAVGVRRLEFLDHPDGVIFDTMRLRREIAAAIRRHRNVHPRVRPAITRLSPPDRRRIGGRVGR